MNLNKTFSWLQIPDGSKTTTSKPLDTLVDAWHGTPVALFYRATKKTFLLGGLQYRVGDLLGILAAVILAEL